MTTADPLIFVAMCVSEMPTPYVPSLNWTCGECRAAVWISRKLLKEAFAADRIVCSVCTLRLLEEEERARREGGAGA